MHKLCRMKVSRITHTIFNKKYYFCMKYKILNIYQLLNIYQNERKS